MSNDGRLAKMRGTLAGFLAARRGNVAVTFALSLIPVFGLVGAAVDYSRGSSTRAALQSALDSAALMLSKELAKQSMTDEQTQQKANDYFRAVFTRPEAQNIQVTATYDKPNRMLVVNGSTTVPTTITRVIGQNEMKIGTSSTIKWGMSRLRVALALDTTGSMSSAGKIDALKTATKGLLTTLKTSAMQNGDVYVSIIPFSKDVNVGTGNANATWIDWTAWDAAHPGGQGMFCWSGWCWNGSTWVQQSSLPPDRSTWNGCVTDRGPSAAPGTNPAYDQKIDPPTGAADTKWPAEQYNECPQPMMGLSYDWNSMNTLVDSLTPNGSTNQPIGLVWAWQSLVGGGGLTAPTKEQSLPYTEAIILMSDGLNTKDRWYGNGSQVSSDVDHRMLNTDGTGTCKNIKDLKNADGTPRYVIYTVQVNTDGDPVSTLLQNCASPDGDEPKGPKFFHLTAANQMVTTFDTIATKLAKLRIAK
jgi:Flp pilus assembly protein TadG